MKIFRIKAVAALLVALPLLASCDSDPWYDDYWYDDWTWGSNYDNRPADENVDNEDFFVAMAQTLAGQWRGGMMTYELDSNGVAIDSLLHDTDIEFKAYNKQSISGVGTQYDYEPGTDNLEYQRDFTWYIDPKTGDVYLTYKEKQSNGEMRDYVMVIGYNDLNLDNRTFTGYLEATDGREVDDFWFDRHAETRATKKKGAMKIKIVMK